jgi:glutamyl-tRNA reductase
MIVSLISFSYQTMPLVLLEKVTCLPEKQLALLQACVQDNKLDEAMLLSTCNRVEWLIIGQSPQRVMTWLSGQLGMSQAVLMDHAHIVKDVAAVMHVMEVACGLQSMLVGEANILGQLKQAWQQACQAQTVGQYLHRLVPMVFSVAKKVRTQTNIGQHAGSLAQLGVRLIKHIFAQTAKCHLLMIGAGALIDELAPQLLQHSWVQVSFMNRTVTKAQSYAKRYQGQAYHLDQLSDVLGTADVVITATSSAKPILTQVYLQHAMQQRHYQPMLLLDLGLPRDVTPEASNIKQLFLYDLAHIHSLLEQKNKAQMVAIQQSKTMIEHQAAMCFAHLETAHAMALIRQFRWHINEARDVFAQAAVQQIQQGVAPKKAIEQCFYQFTQKIAHHPTKNLRQAIRNKDWVHLKMAKALLHVPSVEIHDEH